MGKKLGNNPAFPSGEDYVSIDVMGNRSEHKKPPFHKGMDVRTYIATKALAALLSVSYGENGYVPGYADDQFVPDENGSWHKTKYGWTTHDMPTGAKRFKFVGTTEQRFAHDAVAYADALIAELSKT